MPKQLPYCFRYSDPNTQRVFYYKGYNRYCIQKVHKDHVFFRCDDSNEPIYAMPMPEASKFDRLILP